MIKATIAHVWMSATFFEPRTNHLQELEPGDAMTASLAVCWESAMFIESASATLTARVQVSNDRAAWKFVNEASPDVSMQVSATAAGQFAGTSQVKPALAVSGWRWLRVQYYLTSTSEGPADAIVSAQLNVE